MVAALNFGNQHTSSILIWSAVMMVVVIVLFVVVNAIRKATQAEPSVDTESPFSLDDLRRMHRDGRLTDEEFEKAKAQVIAMAQGTPATPQTPESPESSPESATQSEEPPDNGEDTDQKPS